MAESVREIVVRQIGDGFTVVHTYPIEDLFVHQLVGYGCKCKPRVERYGVSAQVIHNSWDGRELVEQSGVQ